MPAPFHSDTEEGEVLSTLHDAEVVVERTSDEYNESAETFGEFSLKR